MTSRSTAIEAAAKGVHRFLSQPRIDEYVPSGFGVYTYRLDPLCAQIEALRAALAMPEEPKVERVEVRIVGESVNGPALIPSGQTSFKTYHRSEGWKFYAERPIPPKPKEPTLAEKIREWASDESETKAVLIPKALLREAADELDRRGKA